MKVVKGQVEALLIGIVWVHVIDELIGCLNQSRLILIILTVNVLTKLNFIKTNEMSEVDVKSGRTVFLKQLDLPVVVSDRFLLVIFLSYLFVVIQKVIEKLLKICSNVSFYI